MGAKGRHRAFIFCYYSLIALTRGLSLNLKLTILTGLVAQGTARIHLSLLPDAGVIGMHNQAWIFGC